MSDGNNLFVIGRIEQRHTLCGAARDTDIGDRAADNLAPVGHQHHLITVFHWERGCDSAIPAFGRDIHHTLSAAAGRPVFKSGCPLAIAVFGHSQHELLFFR